MLYSEGLKGKKLSDYHIQRIIETHTNRKKVINLDTGEIFASCKDAANYYNVDMSTLSKVCRGIRTHKVKGFRFRYVA